MRPLIDTASVEFVSQEKMTFSGSTAPVRAFTFSLPKNICRDFTSEALLGRPLSSSARVAVETARARPATADTADTNDMMTSKAGRVGEVHSRDCAPTQVHPRSCPFGTSSSRSRLKRHGRRWRGAS
ncbi:MAG: hypothetical protein NVS4B10_13880 [Myxococcales bacterium]